MSVSLLTSCYANKPPSEEPVAFSNEHPPLEHTTDFPDDTYGYMDLNGNIVIATTYKISFEDLGSRDINFHDGVAKVLIDNKYGFIDTLGK